jgi:hypothetical protein
MKPYLPHLDIRRIYDGFDEPVTLQDCGQLCASYNPSGMPFCCDICFAVPAVYRQEWSFLQQETDMWRVYSCGECPGEDESVSRLLEETPDHMILLACHGPERCRRDFRALSCRQFPFFPYITSDYRFIGLAGEWEFERECWVLNHLEAVTQTYRQQFIRLYDELFALWDEDFEAYAARSEDTRQHFIEARRRMPLLHRNGGHYLLSPRRERLRRIR